MLVALPWLLYVYFGLIILLSAGAEGLSCCFMQPPIYDQGLFVLSHFLE